VGGIDRYAGPPGSHGTFWLGGTGGAGADVFGL
jgi:hypothetical protein